MAQIYEYGRYWNSDIPRSKIKRRIGRIRLHIKMTRAYARRIVKHCSEEKFPIEQATDYAMLYYKRKFVEGFRR